MNKWVRTKTNVEDLARGVRRREGQDDLGRRVALVYASGPLTETEQASVRIYLAEQRIAQQREERLFPRRARASRRIQDAMES